MNSMPTRREMLGGALGVSLACASPLGNVQANQSQTQVSQNDPSLETFQIRKGRIRQSVMGWCFNPMPVPELIGHCKEIGLVGIEGIPAQHYEEAKRQGLEISLVSSHGFAKGPVDPRNHDEVITTLRKSIDLAVEVEASRVITFTGMRVDGMEDQTAENHCITCWQQVIGYAEEKGIMLCLEHLNSRDDTHPMKGHPGYFGDDLDRCVQLIERMNSPCFRLLFDIYHVQIMHGDVIRRIRAIHPLIGHYHTAGNPGRCELDEHQEINYPPILRAILETGYEGFVAQEFIPTWSDPVKALRHAAMICDV